MDKGYVNTTASYDTRRSVYFRKVRNTSNMDSL